MMNPAPFVFISCLCSKLGDECGRRCGVKIVIISGMDKRVEKTTLVYRTLKTAAKRSKELTK